MSDGICDHNDQDRRHRPGDQHRDGESPLASAAIAVFAKAPQPGHVKTRLASGVGQGAAVELYRAFLADIADNIARLSDVDGAPASRILAAAGDAEHAGFEPYRRANFEVIDQGGGALGERMARVTRRCFGRGVRRLVIIGTDSPTLSAAQLDAAFDALADRDVVVGPSFDGGYYLMGLSGPHVEVFDQIDWSTEQVFGQTLRQCRDASLLCETLEFWYDVDTFGDLKLLKTHLFNYLRYRQPSLATHTATVVSRLCEQGHL